VSEITTSCDQDNCDKKWSCPSILDPSGCYWNKKFYHQFGTRQSMHH